MCRSTDPRDKRTRVGAIVETDGGTRILIDTPTELRLQLLSAGVTRVDAILFTHDHADHVMGIDDIRALSVQGDQPIDIYGSADTMQRLAKRFAYIFDDSIKALPGTSKPEGHAHALAAGRKFRIGDVEVLPVAVPHGPISVYAYRIGNLGYITDAKSLPDEAVEAFEGVSVLVLNALFRTQHPTHLSVSEAVAAARKVGANQTWLTHLTHRTGHAELEKELPAGIAPAYDGLTIDID
ncbi:MAG TPA: MBL fold metallo-hydrolase [Gemmatimonadaceae bacterium]|nr:MBL fold metallo-hydrolase [Gemmatimonadaceae bacterium]